jgi:tetratricopeptide (TPR) repeat protein
VSPAALLLLFPVCARPVPTLVAQTDDGPSPSTLLRIGSTLPLRECEDEAVRGLTPYLILLDAERGFEETVRSDPRDAGALLGLGDCRMRMGEYRDAVHTYQSAAERLPQDQRFQRSLLDARAHLQAIRAASKDVDRPREVFRVAPAVDAAGGPWWLVLTGVRQDGGFNPKGYMAALRLALYEGEPRSWRRIWNSPILRDTRAGRGEFDEAQLYVRDLTGDGKPEAVVWKVFYGGSATPTHADLFERQGEKMVRIGDVAGSLPCWFEDLNADGRVEIGNFNEIGHLMCHAAQPRWTDIYRYKNGKYTVCNRDFPDQFDGWVDELTDLLEEYPDDYDIWKHLGRVHEIQGRPKEAFEAYRRAEAACEAAIAAERPEWRHYHEERLRSIRARLYAVSGEAERDLARAQDLGDVPMIPGRDQAGRVITLRLEDAEKAFRAIIHSGGTSADAYVGLAECRARLGKYADAVAAYRRAIELLPLNAAELAGLQIAEDSARAAEAVSKTLLKRRDVLEVQPFGVGGAHLWAVLSARSRVEEDFPLGPRRFFNDVRLGVYEMTGTRVRRLAQSAPLVDNWGDPGEFNEAHLYLLDLTGDGVPDPAVLKIYYGADWEPSHLEIFSWRHSQLAKTFGVAGDEPLWIEDIDQDGRYEFGNSHCIGDYYIGNEISHAGMPAWGDIYAWQSGRYAIVDSQFPDEFRRWPEELTAVLKEYPGDWEIRKYLGIAYEILGRPEDALAEYRRAADSCAGLLKDEPEMTNADSRARWRSGLEDIQRRIQALSPQTPP